MLLLQPMLLQPVPPAVPATTVGSGGPPPQGAVCLALHPVPVLLLLLPPAQELASVGCSAPAGREPTVKGLRPADSSATDLCWQGLPCCVVGSSQPGRRSRCGAVNEGGAGALVVVGGHCRDLAGYTRATSPWPRRLPSPLASGARLQLAVAAASPAGGAAVSFVPASLACTSLRWTAGATGPAVATVPATGITSGEEPAWALPWQARTPDGTAPPGQSRLGSPGIEPTASGQRPPPLAAVARPPCGCGTPRSALPRLPLAVFRA